jgi:hypothetical protein
MTELFPLIARLSEAGVEFIIVGGVAGALHGAARPTKDLDVVYRRTPENILRVIRSLEQQNPYPRGAPDGLPFRWDDRTLKFGENFTLRTSLGLIDLLGAITGGGNYEQLLPYAIKIQIGEHECLCLDLQKLIEVKRAAGRPKDFEAIAELEIIRDDERPPGEKTQQR